MVVFLPIVHVASFILDDFSQKSNQAQLFLCPSSDQQNPGRKLIASAKFETGTIRRKRRTAPQSPRDYACPFPSVVHYTSVEHEKISVQCTALYQCTEHNWATVLHCTVPYCVLQCYTVSYSTIINQPTLHCFHS